MQEASPERAKVKHRNADGLAMAARGMLAQRNNSIINALPNIKVPSLVLVGADDTGFLAATEYMARKIPDNQKVVIPKAGHAANSKSSVHCPSYIAALHELCSVLSADL